MSNQLDSALVIELADAIKWGAALAPTAADGSLTAVDPSAPLDITKYARRDRELQFRDQVNATAILRLAMETDTVWNADVIRPPVQGVTTGNLPYVAGDTGRVDSTVVHVKNTSLPKDALSTDQDLMGRDQLIYEVLVKAAQIFSDPPLTTSGAPITGVSAWSQAEGQDYGVQPSPSLPLNRDALKLSDVTLAEHDNQVAAYAAQLCQVLKNPFSYATRLYVRVDGSDSRDAEVYTLIRVYYQPGEHYDAGNEVFYRTKWYRARVPTSNLPTTADWLPIPTQTERIFTAEPALPFRNRIVYDINMKTLQWFRENAENIMVPQLFALSIPGMFWMQTITTVPQVPERKDAQFWRLKASRLSYSGTIATPLASIPDTTVLNSGVIQTDTVGLTAPGAMTVPLGVPLKAGRRYRFSTLMRPSQSVEIFGVHNFVGLGGTNQGADFTGNYTPTTTAPGSPVKYSVVLPPGNWNAEIEYTNVSGTTQGFGVQVQVDGITVKDDTAPYYFLDSAGNPLPNGTLLTSDDIPFTSTGLAQTFSITWTYGNGLLSVHKIRFFSTDHFEGEYYITGQIFNGSNVVASLDTPSIESTGRKGFYEIGFFDFTASINASNPNMRLTWSQTSQLPIQFRQFALAELDQTFATPGIEGFEGFKWDCIRRAERSVQAAFSEHTRTATSGTVPNFTVDGTQWNAFSNDAWMAFIEANEPRLRQQQNVDTVIGGRQYQVVGGYVIYNGGTFVDGSLFYGTNTAPDFTSHSGAVLNQIGAFRIAYPTDLAFPALLPLGLAYSTAGTGVIAQQNDPIDQVPTIVALQPWMVEAGMYVVDGDLTSPIILPNTSNVKAPTVPPPQPVVYGPLYCPVVTTYPTITWSSIGPCYGLGFDLNRRQIYAINQGSGGLSAIDIISSDTNTYVGSSTTGNGLGGGVFGTFGGVFDPVNDAMVLMSQAHGWSTWLPRNQTWHGYFGYLTGNLTNNAGNMRTIACDTKRGHTLYVAFGGPGTPFECISVNNSTGGISLVGSGSSGPYFYSQNPVYSGAIDKFLIFNGSNSNPMWWYLDPVTFTATPSNVTTQIAQGGNGEAITMGCIDELGIGIVRMAAGGNVAVVDLVHDTIAAILPDTLGFPMEGVRRNFCTGDIFAEDGQSKKVKITVLNGTYSSTPINGVVVGDCVFDPYSNRTYAIVPGSTQIDTF